VSGVKAVEVGNEQGEGRVWISSNGEGKVRVYGVDKELESEQVATPISATPKKGRDVRSLACPPALKGSTDGQVSVELTGQTYERTRDVTRV